MGKRRSERAASFRSSLNQSTTLPIAMQTSHWSQLSGTVPKAVLRNPIWTTATCNGAPQPPVDKQMTERAHDLGARVEAVE